MTHPRLAAAALLAATTLSTGAPAEVLLQYYESRWETIERRMPDVFMAGYDGLWVPPPGRSDTGGYSVGYDVFDRFDLGTPFSQTLYGTTQSFHRMSNEMDLADINLYVDVVLNHNGFRDQSTPDFETFGSYPGFVVTLPGDIDGDFHSIFSGGDIEGRVAGLIDIAQEKNHVFTRHPVPGEPNNIPNETPRESNRQFYPDQHIAPFDEDGVFRWQYNIADPLAGDPVQENATALLVRYLQWLVEVHGVDGYRIDVVKHIPTWFYNNFYDPAVYKLRVNPIDGSRSTPFSFGENYTGDFGLLGAYMRKDGFGNRDALDFPLYFAMRDVFNAGGFGSMRNLEFSSVDGIDGNYNDGSRGVMFAGSHDDFGAGHFNGFSTVAHAHILTRTGLPLVYYNAKTFGNNRDFPKDGRGDALGNYSDHITRLVRVHDTHIRGAHITRWIDDDTYVYERDNAALIGISDRGDAGFDTREVPTNFAPGTVLVELSGTAQNMTVDPEDDIFDSVTVDGNGRVSIRVPRNVAPGTNEFHGRGYVVYGPAVPASVLTVTNLVSTIGPDPDDGRLEGTRRLSSIDIVQSETINVELTVDASAAPHDNALIKVNYGGLDIDGDMNVNAHGEFAGFESFPTVLPPMGDLHTYQAQIDATQLPDGLNYIETVAFRQRASGPALFDVQRRVVYLDREPPAQDLLFPTRTGTNDITSSSYEAVVEVDRTANSVHILTDVPAEFNDGQILGLVNGGNQARRHDRIEYRRVLGDLEPGTMEITVVVFEETGTYSIQRYGGIGVNVPLPQLLLGADYNLDPCCASFFGLPNDTSNPALAEDIVVRVKTQNYDGMGGSISFPADYSVTLQVDDGPIYTAVPYDAGLLPPVGRLVQNDQQFGDDYDEFRFVWRGYGHFNHTFRATAELTAGGAPPNQVLGNIYVQPSTPGPSVTIDWPAPPSQSADNPTSVSMRGTFNDNLAAFAQAFIDLGDGGSYLLGQFTNPGSGPFDVSKAVDSYAVNDVLSPGALAVDSGTYPMRLRASTGANGAGIVEDVNTSLTITGAPSAPVRGGLLVDGNADDLMTMPVIAVSPADGPGGGFADFGADGTLTELRAEVRGGTLYVLIRGDMFGAEETNDDNITILLLDVNFGSGNGVTNVRGQLNDTSDGTRSDISNADFSLSGPLVAEGAAFDLAIGVTAASAGYGYSFGSDGLPGSFTAFQFMPSVAVNYDADVSAFAPAAGASYSAPNAIEISIPLSTLGNPEPSKIRLAAVTASDAGYASPNTLPENSSDEFEGETNPQVLEDLASIASPRDVLINELAVGLPDRIELYNSNGTTVDLAGWVLHLRDSADLKADYVFPTGVSIPAHGYLVISDQGGAASPPANTATEVFTGFNIPWDESRGGSAALLDPYGVGVDFVRWRSTDDLPSDDVGATPYGTGWSGTIIGPATMSAGHSLARDMDSTDTDSASDWNNESGANATMPTFGGQNVTQDHTSWILF